MKREKTKKKKCKKNKNMAIGKGSGAMENRKGNIVTRHKKKKRKK